VVIEAQRPARGAQYVAGPAEAGQTTLNAPRSCPCLKPVA
jgi:hypothetical protein